jgi:predicted RNase H-like HicB family nuclease
MGIYIKGLDLYPAMISREGGKYLARFIDIPNCIAFGNSAIEAEINAAHALASHFRFLGYQGTDLPCPSQARSGDQGHEGYVAYIKSRVDVLVAAVGAAPASLARAA